MCVDRLAVRYAVCWTHIRGDWKQHPNILPFLMIFLKVKEGDCGTKNKIKEETLWRKGLLLLISSDLWLFSE